MGITRWSTPKSDWLYSVQSKMEKPYTVSKRRLGADCGSDHELLIAKSRLKLKKIRKATRQFSNDLNQTLCDYTVDVTNRFKWLNLIDRVPDELWTEVHDIVQEAVIKTISVKKKFKRQNGCLRRPYKQLWKEKWKAKEKRKDISIWMQSSKE